MFGIHIHKSADGMITQRIAGSPVADIFVDPVYRQVFQGFDEEIAVGCQVRTKRNISICALCSNLSSIIPIVNIIGEFPDFIASTTVR